MAAYAALVSLSHILHQILHPPPLNKIVVDRQQTEFLQRKVDFMIDFLETYPSRRSEEVAELETRIAYAAYAAEDIIESNVVKQIRANGGENIFILFCKGTQKLLEKFNVLKQIRGGGENISNLLCEDIQTVLEKFLSIEKELVKMREMQGVDDRLPRSLATVAASSSLPSGNNTMVGFDEHMIQIMEALATRESNRQIIPIVGMGGIGKTTLARNVYNHPFIQEYFDIHAWVAVSQEYNVRGILLGLLDQIIIDKNHKNLIDPEKSDDQLGEHVYRELFGTRYLIVMDDIWNIEAWDNVRRFLPPNDNGSRILATTRLSNLAVDFGSRSPHQIRLLDEEKSWDLLREKVFGKEDCPVELEEVGKDIAKKCKGLPLALVVIGGLLAKSERTKEHWDSVEEDVTSAIDHGNDEHFMKILLLSYSQLPIYLKPCFLYLAVFPEDYPIRVSLLIRLWVAEGFIKPTKFKSLEDVAKEFVEDLISRNLILIIKRGGTGNVKCCGVHDLIRELCRREAQKDKFLRIIQNFDNPNISAYLESERRLSIHYWMVVEKPYETLRPVTINRSLLNFSRENLGGISICDGSSLLRILDVSDYYRHYKERHSSYEIQELINLRYYASFRRNFSKPLHSVPSSLSLLWNLQTLVLNDYRVDLPDKIWEMPQLRHLEMYGIILSDPPDGQNIVVLENLQTLLVVENLTFTDEVVERIPNLKKLGVYYDGRKAFCLSNVGRLHKLESLRLHLGFSGNWGNITFPSSLKKLTLYNCLIPWEDMSIVGKLPNLEVLKLRSHGARGPEWNPVEGEFCKLKVLFIHDGNELQSWGANDTHFPRLERLSLYESLLMEIPKDFVEIPTLQVINMERCSSFLLTSAKEISEERESLGYESLQLPSKLTSQFPEEEDIVKLEKDAKSLINFLKEESDRFEVIWITSWNRIWGLSLAWKIYRDPEIRNEFPTLIWVYIYMQSKKRDIFLAILKKFTHHDMSSKADPELAQIVRSYLEGHKFLLFLDGLGDDKVLNDIEAELLKSDGSGKIVIISHSGDVVEHTKYRRALYKSTLYSSRRLDKLKAKW